MDRLVIWGLFCFQRWGERRCFFCGREGSFFSVGKMKHGFWQEGRGSFGTSAIGFFQQEGERKVVSRRGGKAFSFWQEGEGLLLLLSCRLGMFLSPGREGCLLMVGESGDCRGSLHPCILSSLVFHSGFLSISIPFIVFLHVAHVPVGKGSPYGRRGRLLVPFLFICLLPFHPSLASLPWPCSFCFAFLLAGTLSGESG